MITHELCKKCYELGHSCCKTQPVMTENEAAKIYYKHGDKVLDNCQITRVADGMFVYAPSNIIKNGQVYINDDYCVFFDKETASCKIYEDRPQVCRDFGEINALPCPFSDLDVTELAKLSEEERIKRINKTNKLTIDTLAHAADMIKSQPIFNTMFKVPELNKKILKNIKEDSLIILIMYYINNTAERDNFFLKQENTYKLALIGKSKISALKVDKLVTVDETNPEQKLKTVAKLHNFLFSKVISKPVEYQELIVDKINRLLSGLTLKDCDVNLTDDIIEKYGKERLKTIAYYVFAATIFKKYREDFKKKSNQYKGFSHDDLMQIFFDASELTGGYDNEGNLRRLFFNPYIRCIIANAETAYKHIMSNLK